MTKQYFEKSFHWNLWWSILYECLRILHNILLARSISQIDFGIVGTLFATIFLLAKCADMGSAYSIAPFFSAVSQDKKNFKEFIVIRSLLPMLSLLLVGLALFNRLLPQAYHVPAYLKTIVVCIGVLESCRSFFRQFLHTAFKSQAIVISEFTLFIGYLCGVWGAYYFLHIPLTPTLIFGLFLIDSSLAILFFLYQAYCMYQQLPATSLQQQPSWKRIIGLRISNFFIRMSTNLSTTNILTPLFAITFGLKSAGIFYLISTITMAIQAIIKASIGHPGNALLATVKHQGLTTKQEAFSLLSTRFLIVILGIIIALWVASPYLWFSYGLDHYTPATLALVGAYVVITISDLFVSLYEYFYILEESMIVLCSLRLLEIVLFYLIVLCYKLPPTLTLCSIFCIRSSLVLSLIGYARYAWQLKLNIATPLKYTGGCFTILLVIQSLYKLLR